MGVKKKLKMGESDAPKKQHLPLSGFLKLLFESLENLTEPNYLISIFKGEFWRNSVVDSVAGAGRSRI